MVHFSTLFALSVVTSLSSAVPLNKRIAQTIADSTTQWLQACVAAGGAQQCNSISQQAFSTLLAADGNCDQQDAADAMIDLAKQLNSNADMIRLAQIFVQQPRNAPDSLQVPYCQQAPKNPELDGLFHCQFSGSDFTKFSGDQTGNLPLGLTSVNPPGSCPAKTDGPVPDGVQLNTLVTSPGTPEDGNATTPVANTSAPANKTLVARQAKSFTLQNGVDAQKLNAQFSTFSADTPCTDNESACVDGQFSQCVAGKFVSTPCAGGLQCFALPLVNEAGTTITCTSESDADARIAATGATGGVTGA